MFQRTHPKRHKILGSSHPPISLDTKAHERKGKKKINQRAQLEMSSRNLLLLKVGLSSAAIVANIVLVVAALYLSLNVVAYAAFCTGLVGHLLCSTTMSVITKDVKLWRRLLLPGAYFLSTICAVAVTLTKSSVWWISLFFFPSIGILGFVFVLRFSYDNPGSVVGMFGCFAGATGLAIQLLLPGDRMVGTLVAVAFFLLMAESVVNTIGVWRKTSLEQIQARGINHADESNFL